MEQKREAKKQTIMKQEEVAATNDALSRGSQFEKFLKDATEMDGLLQRFAELLKDACNASSVYFSRLSNDAYDLVGGEVSGQERDTSQDYLKFFITTDEDKSLLKKKVVSGEGVTLELFEPEEPIPDEFEEYLDEETGEYLQRVIPKPEQPPKTVFVPNVLAGPHSDRIKLFTLPKMGCFLGLRIQYESCLHDAILDEADVREKEVAEQEQEEEERRLAEEEERKHAEAEEEEERRRIREEEDAEMTEEERAERDAREAEEHAKKLAAEALKAVETEEEREEREKKEEKEKLEKREQRLIQSLTKRKVGLVLGVDTIGQDRRLTDAEVKTILRMGKALEKTLIRIDRDIFRLERKTRASIREVLRETEPLGEEERRTEIDRQFEQAKRIAADGEKPPTRDDIALQHRQHLIVGLRQQVLELRSYNVCHGPISVLQAVLYLLGYPHEQVADNDNHAEWSAVRALIDEELIARIEELDMRAKYTESVVDVDPHERKKKKHKPVEGTPEHYTSIEGIEALLSTIDPEDLQQRNYVLYELHGFVQDAIHVWKRADKEHRKYMARERARIKHEKEEAAEQARLKAEEEAAAAQEGEDHEAAEEDEE